jgi:hypothetical protein
VPFFKAGDPDSCAILVFTDGTEIKAHIIELNTKQVKYRYCDEPLSASHGSRRSAILRIHYPGEKPVERKEIPVKAIEEPAKPLPPQDSIKPQKKTDSIPRVKTMPGCDQITFRDGTEKAANVLEIGQKEIRYKACDMPEGPVFVKFKSDVFMIVYKDGHREVFKEEEIKQEEALPTYPAPSRERPARVYSAVPAFVFSLMGIWPMWFVGGIIGLIMGARYISRAKADPQAYPQEGFARAAVIISIIVLSISVAIILISLI